MKKRQNSSQLLSRHHRILHGSGTEAGFRAAPIRRHIRLPAEVASLRMAVLGRNLRNECKMDAQSLAEVWGLSQAALVGSLH